jgi:ribose 5-phosphate isomerase B
MPKSLISLENILEADAKGERTVLAEKDSIVTPAAAEKAESLGIRIIRGEKPKGEPANPPSEADRHAAWLLKGAVALGSDHGGFKLKSLLKTHLSALGYRVLDVGTDSEAACDYPEFAYAVASLVTHGDASCGIMVDSIGLASALAANKVPGIRAACCWNDVSAKSSREHNNANILTLGGKVLEWDAARTIAEVWLQTPYAGGRHQTRLDKISDIEKKFSHR